MLSTTLIKSHTDMDINICKGEINAEEATVKCIYRGIYLNLNLFNDSNILKLSVWSAHHLQPLEQLKFIPPVHFWEFSVSDPF